jgi:hypothetical protein
MAAPASTPRPIPSRNACFVILLRSLLHQRPLLLLPETQKNPLLKTVFQGIMYAARYGSICGGDGGGPVPFFAVLCTAVWNGFNVKGVIS